jgi:hypothetical protein
MNFDIMEYSKMLAEQNISVIYSGPIWAEGIDGLAEMLQRRLDFDEMPFSSSQSVFSVFVEQMNNMLMYSAEKEPARDLAGIKNVSVGIFILGKQNKNYFVKTGNFVTDKSAGVLKNRIDFLNNLDKAELRKFFKEQVNCKDDNPESRGAGLGLIEIARRTSSKIDYEFLPGADGLQYFTMSVVI